MLKQRIYYPIYTLSFWRAYFVQMRPYLLFISGVAGAAGISIGSSSTTNTIVSVVAFIPFFLGYGFGQALTDCFQTDTDAISAPYRPLSKGVISKKSVFIVSLCGLLLSGLLLWWLHPLCFLLSLLSVFGLATYSFIKKRIWFAGPFYNAWIVALLPVMGYFSQLPNTYWKFPDELVPIVWISFFSYFNFVLIGYLKDIEADRATGYKTYAVVKGWTTTVATGSLILLVGLYIFWNAYNYNMQSLLFAVAGTVIAVAGQIIAHTGKEKNEKAALIPILATVRSFICLHLSIILQCKPGWWIICILFYLAFEWVLYKRPSKYQV